VPRAPETGDGLRRRIVELAGSASLELTAGDETPVAALAAELPPGTIVYVAHPPKALLEDVVGASLAVQAAKLRACPHLVARRVASPDALRAACERLAAAGVDRALVTAGDRDRPEGPYGCALDVLRTDLLTRHGLTHVGVAGHPEGHRAIGQTLLWRTLLEKQLLAKRTGLAMHIVTQFGFDPAALIAWERCLPEHGIRLPVHVGMAGPASLPQLIAYAMQCGAGASLRGALQGMAAMRNIAGLATSPDQMLARVAQHAGSAATRIESVHFYSFGGAVETARWLRAVAGGRFEIGPDADGFTMPA
jgi:methylenetetrahydrofolate reductase (NADPH)